MRTGDRRGAHVATVATGLLLGLAVLLAGGLVLYLLRTVAGAGYDVLDPLLTGVLVAAMVVVADHLHRHRRG